MRSNETFVLTGMRFGDGDRDRARVKAKRLTAPAATSEQNSTFGGQWFVNETCGIVGEEVWEDVGGGVGGVEVVVGASEAVLVYF